ncbi:hypothetical protein L5515_000538 [Caenorhabditis briggsae]|uniref:Conserved oligomeric Golgi complex subunit 1 n=1 Tax=Caenorhabditis briggsae TaxID=6238 RepID=A0AAE9DYN8_CAEBR|nr:hypothetical protein L3Y34_014457 [Caenorhabditis briggsae]UMM11076.1 hypothetical protein L5515_000538 [Caenorhabditis briggsae]
MDVDRLMRDLTVDQLENIQQNLEKEMEGKRESLREMVGRRYRDVLEASSEVRQVCTLAEKLASDIANTRISYQSNPLRLCRTGSKDEQKAGEHLYAVNYLISSIGNDGGEPLDDIVAFCMVEHLQKQLISNHSSPVIHKTARGLTNRVVATRSELEFQNTSTLLDISRSDWATNQLAAIALLEGKEIGQLLDLYLEKRFDYIKGLIEDSATILSIVDEIKKTLTVVEELFVHGELIHAIHSVCNGQYRCELIREMCADQSYSFERTINEDSDRVWRHMREKLSGRSAGTLQSQFVGEKCAEWIDRTCLVTHKLVSEVCEYFDSLDQIIDLLQAITLSLKQDWPKIGSNRTVYEKLLQTAVVDKAQVLLVQMIESIEIAAKKRFESTSDGPSTAIFDERTYRPDSQSHIGISTQLYKCVKTLWESLEQLNEKCSQFETICAPMADTKIASAMKEKMATNVLQLLLRLCELHSDQQNESTRSLSRARLALALVHSESTLISTLLDKDSQRITSLNQRLHAIIEKNLV